MFATGERPLAAETQPTLRQLQEETIGLAAPAFVAARPGLGLRRGRGCRCLGRIGGHGGLLRSLLICVHS